MPNPQFSQNLNPDDQKTDYKYQGLRVHAAAFEINSWVMLGGSAVVGVSGYVVLRVTLD